MLRSALHEPWQLALHLPLQSAEAGVPVQLPWHSPEHVAFGWANTEDDGRERAADAAQRHHNHERIEEVMDFGF